jgi:hypothetical protein
MSTVEQKVVWQRKRTEDIGIEGGKALMVEILTVCEVIVPDATVDMPSGSQSMHSHLPTFYETPLG